MKRLKVLTVLGLIISVFNSVNAEALVSIEEVCVESIVYEGTIVEYDVKVLENTNMIEMPERERDFKSYMDYRNLGCYLQKDLQDLASTDEYGFRRLDDRYMIAVGTAVSEGVGDYITLILENGTEIKCMVGDIKDDVDTQGNNIVTKANLCVSEFIVDTDTMDKGILRKGSISFAFEDWVSKVEYIKLENRNYFEENPVE